MEYGHVVVIGHSSAGRRRLEFVSHLLWISTCLQQQNRPSGLRQPRSQRTSSGPRADDNILCTLLLPIRQRHLSGFMVHSILALLEAADYGFSIDKTSVDDHSWRYSPGPATGSS